MNDTKHRMLVFYGMVQLKGHRHFSNASRQTMTELMHEFGGKDIKHSWFYQARKHLAVAGFISHRSRPAENIDGKVVQKPGLIALQYKGIKYLQRAGFKGADILRSMLKTWFKKKDKRFPGKTITPPAIRITKSPGDIDSLADTLFAMGLKPT